MRTDDAAPTQEEITAYQARSDLAQMAVIRANAAVAAASEALAFAQAQAARCNTAVANLNVEGALLQQRVNFSRQAEAASAPRIQRAPSIPGLARK